jgi:aspartyl-tRNA(Asn)/glutamyl-tRNA(Gln) amidotransferase subunit C
MTDAISKTLFEHLVHLAALEFDSNEADYLRLQLNKQLKAIDELLAIPLDSKTLPAAHGRPYSPEISQPARSDEWEPDMHTQEILQQAPELDAGFIIVPEIPHTDL